MLLAVDPHKDFIDVEGIAVASVLSLQSSGVYGSKLDVEPAPLAQRVLWVPESDRFPSDVYTSFS